MIQFAEPVPESDLRARIVQLRHDIAQTTLAYRRAHEQCQPERVAYLLRERSALIRQLFEAQSNLLLSYRLDSRDLESEPASAPNA